MGFSAGLMLPDSVCTSSEVLLLLQPSISHPSLSTHIFWHGRSSAGRDKKQRKEKGRKNEDGEDRGRENWFGSRSGDSAAASATLVRFNCGGFAVVDVEE